MGTRSSIDHRCLVLRLLTSPPTQPLRRGSLLRWKGNWSFSPGAVPRASTLDLQWGESIDVEIEEGNDLEVTQDLVEPPIVVRPRRESDVDVADSTADSSAPESQSHAVTMEAFPVVLLVAGCCRLATFRSRCDRTRYPHAHFAASQHCWLKARNRTPIVSARLVSSEISDSYRQFVLDAARLVLFSQRWWQADIMISFAPTTN